jgi:hypothetical protein
MGFLSPKVSTPPPVEAAPPPPPVVKPNTTVQAEAERKRTDPNKKSRKKTIMTGPTGMIEDEEITYKTLLGGNK